MPPMTQLAAITGMAMVGLSSVELIHLEIKTPTMAAGRNAMTMPSANRLASSEDGNRTSARQKV